MPANDSVIRIMCPNLTCKRILAVPPAARGKLVRCRGCGINLRIPANKSADAATSASGDAGAASKPGAAANPAAAPATQATGKAA